MPLSDFFLELIGALIDATIGVPHTRRGRIIFAIILGVVVFVIVAAAFMNAIGFL